MSFENVQGHGLEGQQGPEDGITVLEDFVLPEESAEDEKRRSDIMNAAVTAHLNNSSRENLAAALALLEPLNRNTSLMANSFKPETAA